MQARLMIRMAKLLGREPTLIQIGKFRCNHVGDQFTLVVAAALGR